MASVFNIVYGIATWKLYLMTLFTILFLYYVYKFSKVLLGEIRLFIATNGFPSAPGAHFIHGHLSKFTLDMAMINWLRSMHKYGKTLKFKVGLLNNVAVTHPDTVKLVLNTPSNKERTTWHFIKPYLGDGLFTSSGEKWFRNRRLLTPAFHFRVLQEYVAPMQKCFDRLADTWSSKKIGAVETFKDVNDTTMQVLLDIAFGETGLTEYQQKQLKASIDEVLKHWFKRIQNVFHWSDFIYSFSQNSRDNGKHIAIAHGLSQTVIENSRKHKQAKKSYNSFVDLLLQARTEDGESLSDKEISDEVHSFLFAGQDTVGSAIPYCLHQLAKHEEYQEKCRDEIISIMGQREQITWDDLSQMKFLTMCIKESLRINGPVAFNNRSPEKDIHLENNAVIPKGCPIWVLLESVHHNPSVWPEPQKYDPYRFSAEDADQRFAHALVAFSSGPRNCIGQVFAIEEIKVALVVMLRKFRFRLDMDHPLEMTFPLLRGTKDGMWFNLESIE